MSKIGQTSLKNYVNRMQSIQALHLTGSYRVHFNSPAGLAHFTLRTLPTCSLDGRGTNLQTGRMIMLATTRTEQQVCELPRRVTHCTPSLLTCCKKTNE